MQTLSKTCTNCGFLILPIAQTNIIRPWMWAGLCSVLLKETPQPKCPRCKHVIDMPCITVLYLPLHRRVHVVLGEAKEDAIIREIEKALRQHEGEGAHFELHATLEDLVPPITEHVLAFKSLLKELTQSCQRDELKRFVADRWRELTPLALAAGLVGLTGMVKGIGGYALNQDTGERLPFERMFEAFQEMLAEVQFEVWLRIITSPSSPDYTLEHALGEHILPDGIFGDNVKGFHKLLETLSKDPTVPARLWYASQALFSSVVHAKGGENSFEGDWCEAYFFFELALQEGGTVNSDLLPLRISAQRAADTIGERFAWDAVGRWLARGFRPELAEPLRAIVTRLGYKDLVERVATSISVTGQQDALFELVCTVLARPEAKALQGWPITPIRPLTESLIQGGGADLIERIFEHLQTTVALHSEQQAHLEAWYGECMKLLRQPSRFLQRVGQGIRNWEFDLSLERRVDLWNERANALRLLGNPKAALELVDNILKLIGDQEMYADQRFVLLRNRGILLREAGAVDESRRQLGELLDKCRLEQRSNLLESYAATCQVLCRHNEAINALQEAIHVSRKEKPTVERLTASLGLAYSLAGRHHESLETLAKVSGDTQPPTVLAVIASAYCNLLFGGAELGKEHEHRLVKLLASLSDMEDALERQGDFHLASQNLALLGAVLDFLNDPSAEGLLQRHIQLLERLGRPPDPVTLARLAARAYQQKNRHEATKFLERLPNSLVESFGGIHDISIAYDTTGPLKASLDGLMGAAMLSGAPWSDCRLIAELKRDTIGKARVLRQRKSRLIDTKSLEGGVTDDKLARIAQVAGPLAVLEWSDNGQGIFAMLTMIASCGEVRTTVLKRSDLDLFAIQEQVVQRLSVWHAGRKGTPFDFAGWNQFEQWLVGEVGALLPEGQRLAIINGGDLVGLPWHVALGPRWRCSYAASWSVLLDTAPPRYCSPAPVGIFAAPRYNDALPVREAITKAVESTKEWAIGAGMHCDAYQDGNADRRALEQLMAECDVVMLFCHGYADPDDLEIALLVSNSGALPPLFAPGRRSKPDVNRVSWRDLQSLPRSAPLVLSAACSTGIQWQAGAGEQMGLLGALRHSGTSALIGPRWDVTAPAVLPLLTKVLARHLDGGLALVDALHETCVEAQQTMPRWLAWSLALEGNLL